MPKTDPQLKYNDCGISAIKTVYSIFDIDISRKYIENNIPLEEQGSRLSDIKDFFDSNGCETKYKLLDINYILGNTEDLKEMFPFILPLVTKSGMHYVVVNGLKGNKLKIFDPSKGSVYFLSIQELKKKSNFTNTTWEYADTNEKIHAICSEDLSKYSISIEDALIENDIFNLFNKLTYFTYIKDNFGFKNEKIEKEFLEDLIQNQEIQKVPKHFRSLKYENEKVNITAPLILIIKKKAEKITTEIPIEKKQNLFWTLFSQLKSLKKLWYIYIFSAIFSASTAQFAVFINQILIDTILPSYNINTLTIFIIGIAIYLLFDLSTSIYKSFVSIHLGNLLDKFFLQSFNERVNSFSLPYIQSYKKGDLLERVSDSLKLKSFFLSFFTSIFVDVFVSIYSLGILFYINWKIAIIVLFVMVLFYIWFTIITPYLKQNERIRYIKKADFISKMIEKIDGIQVIKSFKMEEYHSLKVQSSINQYLHIQVKNSYVSLINKFVVSSIVILSSLAILYFLTQNAIEDQNITLGQIITFLALSAKIFSSLRSILEDNISLQENEVILKRYLDFKEDTPNKNHDGITNFELQNLELKDINFGYFTDELILNDINLTINKGEKIKIEGHNGSGKSTLSKVLTALYTPLSGSILINNISNKLYNSEFIRDKILLVTNEDILFNDSIYDNISLGRELSIATIIDYAKKIDFYDFIISKDDSLDFIINENGKNLSTGQRKKILLLRALLSKAEIIILDEVLSGMDMDSRNKVEQLIQDTNDKTFIVISHEAITNIRFNKNYKITNGKLDII